MFFLVFDLFLECFFNMHLCAKLQPYRSNNYAHLLRTCLNYKLIIKSMTLTTRKHDSYDA